MILMVSVTKSSCQALLVCVVLTGCWLSIAIGAEPTALEQLQWLAGHWMGSAGGIAMEEIWTEPGGGVMLGLHRDVMEGRPTFFEYLRIEQRNMAVVYVASPRGGGATEFTLVSASPAEVVFENPEHDFPQRIIYRRHGDLLIARIEGDVAGETRAREWEWRLRH